MILTYQTDSTEALSAIAAPGLKNIWINGSETIIFTGEHYTPPVAPGDDPYP